MMTSPFLHKIFKRWVLSNVEGGFIHEKNKFVSHFFTCIRWRL